MGRSIRTAAWRLAACLVWAGGAFAQSQTFVFEQNLSGYTGFDDTTIFSEADNSGGGTDGIFSGTINNLTFDGQKQHRRALVRLDLASIPSGWIVENVSLKMTVATSGGNFGNINYSLHRVLEAWGEGTVVGASEGGFGGSAQTGDATWSSGHHGIAAWSTPGANFSPTPSATAAAGTAGDAVTWADAGLIDDVQLWVNIPFTNQGWIAVSAIEGQRQRVKKFHSSEAAQFRPIVTITASPGPPLGPANSPVFVWMLAALFAAMGPLAIRRATGRE